MTDPVDDFVQEARARLRALATDTGLREGRETADMVRLVRSGQRERSGEIASGLTYRVHGIGCLLSRGGVDTDLDMALDGRSMFDAWRVRAYVQSLGLADPGASPIDAELGRHVEEGTLYRVRGGWYSWTAPPMALDQHLRVIEGVAHQHDGVAELEPYLVSLLADLREVHDQADAEAQLIGLTATWPFGSAELLEFTMRELQWPAVRDALTSQLTSDVDFRFKDEARRVLEVYEADWPRGEIYRTYRGNDQHGNADLNG